MKKYALFLAIFFNAAFSQNYAAINDYGALPFFEKANLKAIYSQFLSFKKDDPRKSAKSKAKRESILKESKAFLDEEKIFYKKLKTYYQKYDNYEKLDEKMKKQVKKDPNDKDLLIIGDRYKDEYFIFSDCSCGLSRTKEGIFKKGQLIEMASYEKVKDPKLIKKYAEITGGKTLFMYHSMSFYPNGELERLQEDPSIFDGDSKRYNSIGDNPRRWYYPNGVLRIYDNDSQRISYTFHPSGDLEAFSKETSDSFVRTDEGYTGGLYYSNGKLGLSIEPTIVPKDYPPKETDPERNTSFSYYKSGGLKLIIKTYSEPLNKMIFMLFNEKTHLPERLFVMNLEGDYLNAYNRRFFERFTPDAMEKESFEEEKKHGRDYPTKMERFITDTGRDLDVHDNYRIPFWDFRGPSVLFDSAGNTKSLSYFSDGKLIWSSNKSVKTPSQKRHREHK